MERVAASEEGSEGFIDGGGELEREEAVGEHDSSQTVMKMRRGRHLRWRRGTVELQDTTVTANELWGGRIGRGRERAREEGGREERRGSTWGFIG
jgi:hypothetical protein